MENALLPLYITMCVLFCIALPVALNLATNEAGERITWAVNAYRAIKYRPHCDSPNNQHSLLCRLMDEWGISTACYHDYLPRRFPNT